MDRTADTIIIGAGIIGCAIAHELARRGRRVLILDMRGVAAGSTQASAGMLLPYIEAHGDSPLVGLATRSFALYDEFVERARTDAGLDVEYTRNGTLEVAFDEESAERLREGARRLAAAGVGAAFLDQRAARQDEPQLAEGVLGARRVEDHGYVSAGGLTHALATAAIRLGAELRAPWRVSRVGARGGRVEVRGDAGTLEAETVILAGGSWSGQIAIDGSPALPIRPVRGQLVRLAWRRDPPARIIWGPDCYLVPQRDGSLLVGATSEEAGFDERATVAGVRDLLDAACDVVPHAWQAGFEEVRVGLRPAAADGLPVIGRSRRIPGLVYATGHFRNGVLLAPLTARLVADVIFDGGHDPALEVTGAERLGEF